MPVICTTTHSHMQGNNMGLGMPTCSLTSYGDGGDVPPPQHCVHLRLGSRGCARSPTTASSGGAGVSSH